MDPRTFDRWTAAIARYPTRRGALRLLTGGVLAGLLSPRLSASAQRADRDQDGLFDDDEPGVYGTNPDVADTDGDGSGDGEEIYLGTNPLAANVGPVRADTDGDGLYDLDETSVYGTDATYADSDLDGVGDGDEVSLGTDPLVFVCPAHCCPKPAPGTIIQYSCPPGTNPDVACFPPCYSEYVNGCVC
jgi:hypothetical protein